MCPVSGSFQIKRLDGLPTKICNKCTTRSEEVFEFIQAVLKAQKFLSGSKDDLPVDIKREKNW